MEHHRFQLADSAKRGKIRQRAVQVWDKPLQVGEPALTPEPDPLVVGDGRDNALQERCKDTVHQGQLLAKEERAAVDVQLSVHLLHRIHESVHADFVTPAGQPSQVVEILCTVVLNKLPGLVMILQGGHARLLQLPPQLC